MMTTERMTMADKLSALHVAFPTVAYADPAVGHEQGYVSWAQVVTSTYAEEGDRPFIELSCIGKGEDAYGQSSILTRSNYRSLKRDYPGLFVDVSYSNVNALGVFVHDLTEDTLNLIVGLVVEYPVYDESDMSELESDENGEAWDEYLSWDIRSELSEAETDAMDAVDATVLRNAFYAALSDDDYYPEHDGMDIRWDTAKVVAIVRDILNSFDSCPGCGACVGCI